MTNPAEPSRRERRAAQRQEQILSAAAQVFTELGYSGASIKDIAQAADVADGTIYNYFANKEALLLALFDQLVEAEQFEARVARAQQAELSGMMANYFGDHLERVRENYTLFRAVIPEILATPDLRQRYFESFVAPVLQRTERALGALQAQGELVDSVDASAVARLVYAQFFGLLCLRIMGDPSVQPNVDVDVALLGAFGQVFLNGMGANPE
ncbi:MAG: helix-turn-helix transcriptional regulator [Chloroflexi bacterium]|nr:helix-turn-helix transcriptional regulator [Chloroflexota bacterium]